MQNFPVYLKECPLFDNLSDAEISAVMGCLSATVKHYEKKETVFEEGSPADSIGIVISGSVVLTRTDYYGNRSIVSVAGPSEVFSEAFACANVDSLPLSVVASEASDVMLIKSHRLLYTCDKGCRHHQKLIFNLMKGLATKSISDNRKIEITSKRTTREKLLTYLTLESKRLGKKTFSIPYSRQELADYLEVERSGLSVEIGKLVKEGIINADKKVFTIF